MSDQVTFMSTVPNLSGPERPPQKTKNSSIEIILRVFPGRRVYPIVSGRTCLSNRGPVSPRIPRDFGRPGTSVSSQSTTLYFEARGYISRVDGGGDPGREPPNLCPESWGGGPNDGLG